MKNKKSLKTQKKISKSIKTDSKLYLKGINTFVRGPKPKIEQIFNEKHYK